MTRFKPEPMPPEITKLMAFWTTLVEKAKPRGRCRGCALRAGSPANRDLNTAWKLTDTILHGGGFRCHHVGGPRGRVTNEAAETNRPCRGFDTLLVAMRDRFRIGRTQGIDA